MQLFSAHDLTYDEVSVKADAVDQFGFRVARVVIESEMFLTILRWESNCFELKLISSDSNYS